MSEMELPTVMIATANGPVRFNVRDYDPAVHTLYDPANPEHNGERGAPITSEGAETVVVPLTIPAGITVATGAEPATPAPAPVAVVAVPADATGATVTVTNPAPSAPPAYQVAQIGAKFFVVDATGNKVEAEGISTKGYKTNAEAWGAIMPAIG